MWQTFPTNTDVGDDADFEQHESNIARVGKEEAVYVGGICNKTADVSKLRDEHSPLTLVLALEQEGNKVLLTFLSLEAGKQSHITTRHSL